MEEEYVGDDSSDSVVTTDRNELEHPNWNLNCSKSLFNNDGKLDSMIKQLVGKNVDAIREADFDLLWSVWTGIHASRIVISV